MSFTVAALLALAGLVLLTFGADWLVHGASQLAIRVGVSPLVVGLTVVAYGTSAPEIMASVVAAIGGHPDITIGNVIGSNIANTGLILGATAALSPLTLAPTVARRELPFMVLITAAFIAAAWTLSIGRVMGFVLIGLLVAFSYFSIRWARGDAYVPDGEEQSLSLGKSLAYTLVGLGGLLGGAHMLVTGALVVARGIGLSEFVIGVTLVAVGTSLPELATAFIAGLKGKGDLVVGAIIGSNVFNVLGAVGASAALHPIAIDPALLRFEFPALAVFTLMMAVFLRTSGKLGRAEGVVLAVGYFVFIGLLFR